MKPKSKYVVLYCTTGSMDEASKIAEYLVTNHLVACVNVVPSVRSIYRWKGAVHQDDEVLMIMKTEQKRILDVERSIKHLHSYETPELISLPIEYGLPEYLNWIDGCLTAADEDK